MSRDRNRINPIRTFLAPTVLLLLTLVGSTMAPANASMLRGPVADNTLSNDGTINGVILSTPPDEAPPVNYLQGKKIQICHATSSYSNPYTEPDVSINSIENAISVHGHGDHIGGIYPTPGWGDIIPPFTYGSISFPGLNWTPEGQAVWSNGCEPVQTVPAPRPEGCVYSISYWTDPTTRWPVTSLTINGTTYQQSDLLAKLKANNNDLLQQVVLTMLNNAKGAGMTADYQAILASAQACLADSKCKNKDQSTLITQLQTYNSGVDQSVPYHCDKNGLPDIYNQFCFKGNGPDDKGQKCSDNFYGTTSTYVNGTWLKTSTFCMAKSQCPATTTPVDDNPTFPCTSETLASGFKLECPPKDGINTSSLNVSPPSVSTMCPINYVLRGPYPRSLVNVPTNFYLQNADFDNEEGNTTTPRSPDNLLLFVDVDGNPTPEGYAAGIWKDLILYMRTERFMGGTNWFGETTPKPEYTFFDRAWNTSIYPTTQTGPDATYLYQTSSYGQPNLYGRGFDMVSKVPSSSVKNLPAYKVQIETTCGHQWKATVQLAKRDWQPTDPNNVCKMHTLVFPDGTTYEPPGTLHQGCEPGYVTPGKWAYSWHTASIPQEIEWGDINMTLTGLSTTWDTQTDSIAGGIYQGTTYWEDYQGGIWVPVLEVQSVLRGKCVADGTCTPPVAEPGSIAP